MRFPDECSFCVDEQEKVYCDSNILEKIILFLPVAKPARQFAHAICKLKSLLLSISLEIDSTQTLENLHLHFQMSGWFLR